MCLKEGDYMNEQMPDIDWSEFTWPENNTVTCANCHQVYRSHAKYQEGLWAKKECPVCGFHKLCGAQSDPEEMSLKP